MSKRKSTNDNEESTCSQASEGVARKRAKSSEDGATGKHMAELAALLESCDTEPTQDPHMLYVRVSDIVAHLDNKPHQRARAFTLIFERIVLIVTSQRYEDDCLVEQLINGLYLLGAQCLSLIQATSLLSSLLSAALSSSDGGHTRHYHQRWFGITCRMLVRRLDESKQRTTAAFLRASFNRLLAALCTTDDDDDDQQHTIVDTLCISAIVLKRIHVPKSCRDELDPLVDSLLELLNAPSALLPDHLSGCQSIYLLTSSALDLKDTRRVACALLLLLQAQGEIAAPARRQRVLTLVLNALVHFEAIVTSTAFSESATASAAVDESRKLMAAFGQFMQDSYAKTYVINDLGAVVQRLLATCCLRSLTSKSSFVAVLLFSQTLSDDTDDDDDDDDDETTSAAGFFVDKLRDAARLSRLRHSHGWLDASAAAQCECSNSGSITTQRQYAEMPLAHVFGALTSARVRRMLDHVKDDGRHDNEDDDDDDDAASASFSHEESLLKLAMRLMQQSGDVDEPELSSFAARLVDHVLVSYRCPVDAEGLDDKRMEFMAKLVDKCLADDGEEGHSMATRRLFCHEATRLMHSGCSLPPPRPFNSDATGANALVFHSAYVVRALYGTEPSSAPVLPTVLKNAHVELVSRRITLVEDVMDTVHKVTAVADHQPKKPK